MKLLPFLYVYEIIMCIKMIKLLVMILSASIKTDQLITQDNQNHTVYRGISFCLFTENYYLPAE